jgi:two-component system KDP operon response regulator KdpE
VSDPDPRQSVLVVDDEAPLLRTMDVILRARGYDVHLAVNGGQALDRAVQHRPDVVVLDLGLPDIDGLEVIRGLRTWTSVPIIVLSARTAEDQKVAALDAGANDYVSKPFGMDELLARLRVALRPPAPAVADPVIETPDFTIDLVSRRVHRAGNDVHLTNTEWHLVELLARNAGRLVQRAELLEEIRGLKGTKTNYLRVLMVAVRRKLEPDPAHPRYFLTEPGVGIRFLPAGVRPEAAGAP